MKLFLKGYYNYKWIVPNILKVRKILAYTAEGIITSTTKQYFLFHN